MIGHVHLHQDIPREELAFRFDLLAAADLEHLFRRNQHLLDVIAYALLVRLLADRLGDLFLKAGKDVNYVPTRRQRSGS